MFSALTVSCLLAIPAFAVGADEIELFNGKNMEGWTYFIPQKDVKKEEQVKMEDVWSVQDGVIVCKGKPNGYIRTVKEYENYVLTLEWRWKPGSKGGNSGVLLHKTGPEKIWPKSVEAQLMADNAGDIWVIDTEVKVENAGKRTQGRRVVNLTDGSEKPKGEWNKYEITCKGSEIILKINGDLVNHATDASVSKGTIALQSEGTEIHFRNIRLKPLN